MIGRIGDQFQKETKHYRDRILGGRLDWSSQPEIYKEYTGSKKIKLSHSKLNKSRLLDDVFRERRSIRNFSKQSVSMQELSYLLWASTGIQRRQSGYEFRTVPSAGALYPIETYIVVNNVEDLSNGIYHYSVKNHFLEELKLGNFGSDMASAALEEEMCSEAAVVFIWTAVFQRCKWKYKQRAYRYIYLEAGHIAQNLALASVGLGLGNCQIGALFDDEVNRILDVDGTEESVVYMSVVGYPL
jgi:SagB-type dehydrogenase family enzyme